MNGFNTLSSIFDDAISNLFGSSFEGFFSIPTNATYQKREVTKNGHTATQIVKRDRNGQPIYEYFVDGKKTNPKDLPDEFTRELENIQFKTFRPRLFEPVGCNNKLPESIISGTEIPHVNMIHTNEGGLKLEFALAGVSEDRIEITAEDNYLLVTIKPLKPEVEAEGRQDVYLQKGIKGSDGELYKQILIDPKKYELKGLKFEYENGLLTILVPKTKEPEKNKLFFKKAN